MHDRAPQTSNLYKILQHQGQYLGLIDDASTEQNPFPGLRPFQTREAHLFFGREGQSDAMIRKLMATRFLAVLGTSGSGKSSLARAGMIPALHSGFGQKGNYKWKIIILRPGKAPIHNLATQLAYANGKEEPEEINSIEARLNESSYGLVDLASDGRYDKTLILIDQFEELFRFKGKAEPPGARAHFVNLLINAGSEPDAHYYIALTMRSEFLGVCVEFRGLPEKINEGQYLVPRLAEKNIREAITGPLRVAGVEISPTLVNRLVREVYHGQDQLPILQHALMRTHHHWRENKRAERPVGHVDYEAAGGMKEALSRHANEIYDGLSPSEKKIAKRLFQCLVDCSSDEKGGRRPTALGEIAAITGYTVDELKEVAGHFRGMDAPFLIPAAEIALEADSVLDIAHESLIRQWKLLGEWTEEEAENAKLYKRLNARRKDGDLIKGGLLTDLLKWKDDNIVNVHWASRYHQKEEVEKEGNDEKLFIKNQQFLEECRKEAEKEEREKIESIEAEARRRQKEWARRIITAMALGVAIITSGSAIFAYRQTLQAQKAEKKAQEQRMEVERQKGLLAEANTQLISANKGLEEEKERSDSLRRKAEENADEAMRLAEIVALQNERLLEAPKVIVNRFLEEARQAINRLDYPKAEESYIEVANLNLDGLMVGFKDAGLNAWRRKEAGWGLLEVAFVWAETGKEDDAARLLNKAAALFGKDSIFLKGKRPGREELLAEVSRLDSRRLDALQKKYYPDMVPTDTSFAIARTETTVWQFYLFCQNKEKYDIGNYCTNKIRQGGLPVVNVSFGDAKKYAAWVSMRQNKSYRLPTILEWDRLVSLDAKSFDKQIVENREREILKKDSSGPYPVTTGTPVRGLYGLIGNVWEWAEDNSFNSPKGYTLLGRAWTDFRHNKNYKKDDLKLPGQPPDGGKDTGFRLAMELR
ncbi:MAG: SUMF1/EgtB/PvdO family nonheme iron enzyme [Phaeodactylibacter sp.]|nr:SUMF1/EgtB/PvdO family nonheme iron enzyme [Phaeodactylibacter sp.]